MKNIGYRQFEKYFRDTNIDRVSSSAVIERVLDKGSIDDIRKLRKCVGDDVIYKELVAKFQQDRTPFSPKLIMLYALWFNIPDDISRRACAAAKDMSSFLDQFSKDFFLVGGTAIALQIGHRFSIDFDLFLSEAEKLPGRMIEGLLKKNIYSYEVLVDTEYHFEVLLNGVKITWYAYPYPIRPGEYLYGELRMPALVALAAMKILAIQQRAKWKDYVDLSYLFPLLGTDYILEIAREMFGSRLNEKILASQLVYTDDIDFSEEVQWVGNAGKSVEEVFAILRNVVMELQ